MTLSAQKNRFGLLHSRLRSTISHLHFVIWCLLYATATDESLYRVVVRCSCSILRDECASAGTGLDFSWPHFIDEHIKVTQHTYFKDAHTQRRYGISSERLWCRIRAKAVSQWIVPAGSASHQQISKSSFKNATFPPTASSCGVALLNYVRCMRFVYLKYQARHTQYTVLAKASTLVPTHLTSRTGFH